ncbi:DUF2798 domain-containing protein [Rhizobium helianthi]|uniref:DUF2798 domain-containing protein n=1 Tax=Rhizobium helianthi TaxID=1132695 RepID=A0ABW4M9Y4_9HYPH
METPVYSLIKPAGVATLKNPGFDERFLTKWPAVWGMCWLIAFRHCSWPCD